MGDIPFTEVLSIIVLLGSALAVIYKWIRPVMKANSRIEEIEKRQNRIDTKLAKDYQADRLLCKAMIGLIDNRITNNNVEGLKLLKSELMDFITYKE